MLCINAIDSYRENHRRNLNKRRFCFSHIPNVDVINKRDGDCFDVRN